MCSVQWVIEAHRIPNGHRPSQTRVWRSSSARPATEPVALPIHRVVAVGADHDRPASLSFVESVAFPFPWIVADIPGDAFVFPVIADHVVPIIALPYGRSVGQQSIAVCHARNRGFVRPHNAPQRTNGNDGHGAFRWCVRRVWACVGIGGWA